MTSASRLEAARPQLRAPLFDARAVERLVAVARHLPAASQLILEARLAGDSPAVDVSVQLADAAQALHVAQAPLADPLRRFLRRWAEPGGPFAAATRLWLEFDLDQPDPTELPAPVVCARLNPDVPHRELVDNLWPALHGQALGLAQRASALVCLRALPVGAVPLYAFSLAPRGGSDIRLEVGGLDLATARRYLERIAPHHAGSLAPVAALFTDVERLHLSFDLGDEIRPRIGLEGSFPRQPARERRWAEWFDRLVEHGLAARDRAAAALAWPAFDPGLVRGVSHVKVVVEEGRAPTAKVYLTWVPSSSPLASSPASASARST